MHLSIIIPVLNEAENLASMVPPKSCMEAGLEWIVVDGGSVDGSVLAARPWADQVIAARRGRASQMNAGARVASGDYLLFLHADTRLPENLAEFVAALQSGAWDWGFFRVQLVPASALLRLVAASMNLRSAITSVATGDQAIFVRRELFEQVGGFDDIPLMEDVALSKTLRKRGRPRRWGQPVTVSSRRWLKHGVVKTILLMWSLRLQYVLGVSPARLHRRYYGGASEND